jgi:hypothetical protein
MFVFLTNFVYTVYGMQIIIYMTYLSWKTNWQASFLYFSAPQEIAN